MTGSSTLWFSDAPATPPQLLHCLVCFGYGGITVNHKFDAMPVSFGPLSCSDCGAPTWDGLHRNGHRDCVMIEVPGV